MNQDKPDTDKVVITNTVTSNVTVNMETHNHYHLGDVIPPDAPPAQGWVRTLQQGKRTTVEASTREEMDFGSVETKTVAEVSPTGQVTALFRFINILEGGSWDLNSWTVLRDAGGRKCRWLTASRRVRSATDFSLRTTSFVWACRLGVLSQMIPA